MTSSLSTPRRTRPGRTLVDPARMVLPLVCASQFMVILDASIVNVALPSIQRDLGFTPTGLAWVVNGYLLTFAGFLLLGGRVSDLFGQRRILVAGLLSFSAASLVAGLAADGGTLVTARVAQGVGAALLAPTTLAVINTRFVEQTARARAFGAWSAAGGGGGMAGAIAGGALTTSLSWRWVFLINVPIGAVLIVMALIALAGSPTTRRDPLDLPGALTGTAGLGLLVYGVMQGAARGWTSLSVAWPVVAGLVLLVAFTLVEARLATRPMMPLRLFRLPGVAVGNLMLLLLGAMAIAMWYFTSLLLQNVLGYSALRSGLGQSPAAVTFVAVARLAAALLPRLGERRLVLLGSGALFVGFGWLGTTDVGSSYVTGVLGPTLLIGAGIGLTFPTLMAAATSNAPERDAGTVGGLANTANQVGGSIGLAVLATVASASAAADGKPTTEVLASGYALVFLISAGVALAITMIGLLLPRDRRGAAKPAEPSSKAVTPGSTSRRSRPKDTQHTRTGRAS